MNISLIFHALLGNEFFLVLDDDVDDAGDDDAMPSNGGVIAVL